MYKVEQRKYIEKKALLPLLPEANMFILSSNGLKRK